MASEELPKPPGWWEIVRDSLNEIKGQLNNLAAMMTQKADRSEVSALANRVADIEQGRNLAPYAQSLIEMLRRHDDQLARMRERRWVTEVGKHAFSAAAAVIVALVAAGKVHP